MVGEARDSHLPPIPRLADLCLCLDGLPLVDACFATYSFEAECALEFAQRQVSAIAPAEDCIRPVRRLRNGACLGHGRNRDILAPS